MQKIGLVTYYGDNFGACMQAYALQTVLCELKGNCEIIACPEGSPDSFQSHSQGHLIKNALKALLNGKFFSRYKTRKFVLQTNKNIHNRCESFRLQYLNIIHNGNHTWGDFYINIPNYDAYVCGSDQIWNPTFYGQCHPIYYLNFVSSGKRKVAYAPSIGIKNIEDKHKDTLMEYLSTFDAVSVRESNAIGLLQPFCKKTIHWVLDPTLLISKEKYDTLNYDIDIPKEPYVFCYLFGEKKDTAQIKKKIVKRLGLKVVSVPFVAREILSKDKKLNNIGPTDFINLIKNAAFVLTDSFHATAFSINFQVPFVSLLRQEITEKNEMSSRLYSILAKLKLEHRLVKDERSIPRELLNLNFSESELLLNKYRFESIDFLKEALKNGNKDE